MKRIYFFTFLFISFLSLHSQIAFTDVTTTAKLGFNSETVESLAWGDYDNDGDQDLFLTTKTINHLMRNDGNDVFTDVASSTGLTENSFSTGCVFADFDNDGDLDIFVVTSDNTSDDFLYENLGAAGSYVFQSNASSASGLTNIRSVRGVAVLDYNRDGLLDIYVNSKLDPNDTSPNPPTNDVLYKNLGNLTFQDVTTSAGLEVNATGNQGVGAVPTDINNDGWIDIFTGNRSSDPNKLYLNNGGTFSDITSSAGITEVGLGMGVLSFDYDNDLDMDLYWTTWPGATEPFQPNALYQNQGNNTFLDKATETGTLDEPGWGISCNAGDIDNDRFEDMFITNGFDPGSTQSILYRNSNGTSFQDITTSILGDLTYDARGVAFADYDGDGDIDICLTGGVNADTRLWRNDTVNSNNWVTLELEGVVSNKCAIGARVEVTAGGVTTVKEVSGGAGRGSFNSLPVEFGMGSATSISKVKVFWPNGSVENFSSITINQINQIVEGTGTLGVGDNILEEIALNVYPNPFENRITLDLSKLNDTSTITVYTILGQTIYRNNALANAKVDIKIDNNYKGLLFLRIESDNKSIQRKLVKN